MGFKAKVRGKSQQAERMTEVRRPIGSRKAIIDKMAEDAIQMCEEGKIRNGVGLMKEALMVSARAKDLKEFWSDEAGDYYAPDHDHNCGPDCNHNHEEEE